MPPWLWTVIGVLVVIIWSSWSSSSSRTPAMPAVTDDGGLCMSGQVAIGRQFFPQRVVGDTVHSGMALGMPEQPATTGPYKAIDRDHESRSRTEEG